MMKVRYAGSTHVGMKRTHNEDNFFLLADENIYMVADGMGGHSSGEVASRIAVETLANFFVDSARDRDITWPHREDRALDYDANRLRNGIMLANRRVFETAQSDPKYRGMGTTMVGLVASENGVYVGHVGDSRAYKITEQAIEQLTEDHSLLNDYMKVHTLSEEEIANFPHKNVIVRALGMKDTVQVDTVRRDIIPGETYLMCSDGLSGMVTDEEIHRVVVSSAGNLEAACESLVSKANANGGTDNVTVVLVSFTDS